MNSNLEIEYKMLVDQADFEALRRLYPAPAFRQENVYYDTQNGSLKERGIGMRIRDVGDRRQFTLKVKAPQGHQELETEVAENTLKALESPEVQAIFKPLKIEGPFRETGRLITERAEIDFDTGVLCLDKNEYYGKLDYELEFELKPQADLKEGLAQFQAILDQVQLTYKRNKKSKIRRCLEEKEKIQ